MVLTYAQKLKDPRWQKIFAHTIVSIDKAVSAIGKCKRNLQQQGLDL
jgi:hypothetical protein